MIVSTSKNTHAICIVFGAPRPWLIWSLQWTSFQQSLDYKSIKCRQCCHSSEASKNHGFSSYSQPFHKWRCQMVNPPILQEHIGTSWHRACTLTHASFYLYSALTHFPISRELFGALWAQWLQVSVHQPASQINHSSHSIQIPAWWWGHRDTPWRVPGPVSTRVSVPRQMELGLSGWTLVSSLSPQLAKHVHNDSDMRR